MVSTIVDNNGIEREVEGGRRWGIQWECLLDDDRDDNEYDTGNKTMTQRMGRGHAG